MRSRRSLQVAGIHFNDNGWCKMAKAWAQHLLPTLPKRDAAPLDGVGGVAAEAGAAAAAAASFMDPVAQTTRCVIPGATASTAPTAAGAPRPLPPPQAPATPSASRRATCAAVVTVNVSGVPPSFTDFYGNLSAALHLQFGREGAFCAWTSLQPANNRMEMAPWAQHGVVDAWQSVPAPAGPAFSLLQSLGSQLLETTVGAAVGAGAGASASRVGLALGTLRRWATQTTVSAVVNVTGEGGACLEIVGLASSVIEAQCGPGGAAATVVELLDGAPTPAVRALPCAAGAPAGVVRLALGSSSHGTLSAVSFATSHL